MAMSDVPDCRATDGASRSGRAANAILSDGCLDGENGLVCPYAVDSDGLDLTLSRCHAARLDYVFQYIGCVMALGVVVISGYYWMCFGALPRRIIYVIRSGDLGLRGHGP
ncbi:hypothetical protein GGR58DRAFT_494396 [Xylaria digitata]|nr:hypothetical protein GGR58DRAFT_494396 [Xylaria digitata]